MRVKENVETQIASFDFPDGVRHSPRNLTDAWRQHEAESARFWTPDLAASVPESAEHRRRVLTVPLEPVDSNRKVGLA